MLDRLFDRCIPEPNSGCWIWTGAIGSHGYGVVSVGKGKLGLAHRVASGAKPGEQSLHTCDTRSCCNPGHLFNGSQVANMKDCAVKGRMKVFGNPHAGVPDSIISKIRDYTGPSLKKYAKELGVDPSYAYKIRKGMRRVV